MASDLPENPIVDCNLSNSDRISPFNEIETIGICLMLLIIL